MLCYSETSVWCLNCSLACLVMITTSWHHPLASISMSCLLLLSPRLFLYLLNSNAVVQSRVFLLRLCCQHCMFFSPSRPQWNGFYVMVWLYMLTQEVSRTVCWSDWLIIETWQELREPNIKRYILFLKNLFFQLCRTTCVLSPGWYPRWVFMFLELWCIYF